MKTFIFLLAVLCFTLPATAQKTKPPVQTEKLDCQPVLTTAAIRSYLRGKTLKEIPAAAGDDSETEWIFHPKEFLEIDILETKLQGKTKAVSVVQIKSGDRIGYIVQDADGNFEDLKQIEGRIRLNFELVAGKWELLKIENISVKWSPVEIESFESEEN